MSYARNQMKMPSSGLVPCFKITTSHTKQTKKETKTRRKEKKKTTIKACKAKIYYVLPLSQYSSVRERACGPDIQLICEKEIEIVDLISSEFMAAFIFVSKVCGFAVTRD